MNYSEKAERAWKIRDEVIDDIINTQDHTSPSQQAYLDALAELAMRYEEMAEMDDYGAWMEETQALRHGG